MVSELEIDSVGGGTGKKPRVLLAVSFVWMIWFGVEGEAGWFEDSSLIGTELELGFSG